MRTAACARRLPCAPPCSTLPPQPMLTTVLRALASMAIHLRRRLHDLRLKKMTLITFPCSTIALCYFDISFVQFQHFILYYFNILFKC
jgi:hypothetical protein